MTDSPTLPTSPLPPSPHEKRTILYIEDDPASRVLVERTLRYAGYHVMVAVKALEGLEIARRELPDLILTDINLPDLTGRELTTTLRSDPRFRKTPIVALTAAVMRDQREMAMAAGLTGYLTKPLDVEALPSQILYYLNGGRDEVTAEALSEAHTRYAQEVVARLESRIRELEHNNEQLRRLDRMKDSFIQIAAHELRTPLTLLIGYHRLMEENPQVKRFLTEDAQMHTLMGGMSNAIGRMGSIINEILTQSRIITQQVDLAIGPVNLADIVWRTLKGYEEALVARRMVVVFNRAEFPERMIGDWELIALTLRQLISNAIKYTPDGGKIALTARIEGESVRLSVRDTGIGIALGDLHSVFDRFFNSSNPDLHSTSKTAFMGGGIGLGLAVSKGIVEAHGGKIWAESRGYSRETYPGAEFVIVMPLVAQPRRVPHPPTS